MFSEDNCVCFCKYECKEEEGGGERITKYSTLDITFQKVTKVK